MRSFASVATLETFAKDLGKQSREGGPGSKTLEQKKCWAPKKRQWTYIIIILVCVYEQKAAFWGFGVLFDDLNIMGEFYMFAYVCQCVSVKIYDPVIP